MRIFSNPFRLIHELYVHRIWAKNWRKNHPEYEAAYDRAERNWITLIIQFYLFVFIVSAIFGIIMFTAGNYEIVKIESITVDPVELEV